MKPEKSTEASLDRPLWREEFSIHKANERYVSRRQLTKFLTLTSLAMFAGNVPLRTGSSATNQSRYGFRKNPSRASPTLSRSQAPGCSSRSLTSAG